MSILTNVRRGKHFSLKNMFSLFSKNARRILIAPIVFYQKWISPSLPARCRYYPTCSNYAVEAIRIHGAGKGLLLAVWRLLRCNPWTGGGVDHVPDLGKWRYQYPPDMPRP